jgi:hypothetical protein
MKPNEQQQLTIGSTVWCVHPNLTHLLETRVTEMRVFNINWDEPEEPIEEAIEYTLMGVGCELPHAENGKWFVYDGDMMTEYLGEQECYYTDKKVAQSLLAVHLYNLSVKLWDDVKTK